MAQLKCNAEDKKELNQDKQEAIELLTELKEQLLEINDEAMDNEILYEMLADLGDDVFPKSIDNLAITIRNYLTEID
jgi:hypothetical protein